MRVLERCAEFAGPYLDNDNLSATQTEIINMLANLTATSQ